MNSSEVKEIIKNELPKLIQSDEEIRNWILNISSTIYMRQDVAESRFDRILNELKEDRIKQEKKWDEQNRKWDEQNRKWEENQKEIKNLSRKIDTTIGALGTRWGKFSEASFRNAMKGILGDELGVTVDRFEEYDKDGIVFDFPEMVEIDVIIKNGFIYLCEIKSSVSRAEVYLFEKKVRYYESKKNTKATKKILISPMIDKKEIELAKSFGMLVYTHAYDIEKL